MLRSSEKQVQDSISCDEATRFDSPSSLKRPSTTYVVTGRALKRMKTFCYTTRQRDEWILERMKKNRIIARLPNQTVIGLIMMKIWQLCECHWMAEPVYHPYSVEEFVPEDFWVGFIAKEHMWYNTMEKGVLLDEESRRAVNTQYWKSMGYGYRALHNGHFLVIPPTRIEVDDDGAHIYIPGDTEEEPIEID